MSSLKHLLGGILFVLMILVSEQYLGYSRATSMLVLNIVILINIMKMQEKIDDLKEDK